MGRGCEGGGLQRALGWAVQGCRGAWERPGEGRDCPGACRGAAGGDRALSQAAALAVRPSSTRYRRAASVCERSWGVDRKWAEEEPVHTTELVTPLTFGHSLEKAPDGARVSMLLHACARAPGRSGKPRSGCHKCNRICSTLPHGLRVSAKHDKLASIDCQN